MIINTSETWARGQIVTGDLTDHRGAWHRVTFQVLRESNHREYMEFAQEFSPLRPEPPFQTNYYQISMD